MDNVFVVRLRLIRKVSQMFNRQFSLLIVLIFSLLLTACQILGFGKNVSPTPETKIITVYTGGSEQWAQPFVNAFNKEHPDIQINMEYVYAGEMAERLSLTKNNPEADVIWVMPATNLLKAASKGLLQPYAPAGLDRIDPRMRDYNDPPILVGTDVFMNAFCVNREVLEQLGLPKPTSWKDLTNPVYEDQIVMPDPSLSSTGYMTLAAFMQPALFGSEEEGWAYMAELDKNVAWYTKGGYAPCTLAADGKVAIGVSFDAAATDMRAQGLPIDPVFPAEGSGWEVEANALVKKPEIKPEALTFLDWAISDNTIRLYAQGGTPVTSVRLEDITLPDGYVAEPQKHLIPLSFLWTTANRERIVDRWVELYGQKSEGYGAAIPEAFQ
jgi:iron(III) transport system substrate-binding protein